MFKKALGLSLVLTIGLWGGSFSFAQDDTEKITITTYYPSPFGIYNELRAKRMAIGPNYYDPSQHCWSDGSCDFPDIDDVATLVVEGRVYQPGLGGSTFFGDGAGYNDDLTDNYNTAFGYQALYSNTSGYRDTAMGAYALYANTQGSYNTAVGGEALFNNTTGNNNTAVGMYALHENTKGYRNTAVGVYALYSNTTGYDNTAVGVGALLVNTEGYRNTAMGLMALSDNTEGYYNTAVGFGALERNSEGYHNTAVGWHALYWNTEGYYNTAIGTAAGQVSSANRSVYLGAETKAAADGDTNEIVIGYGAVGHGSNTARIGNDEMVWIGGKVPWSATSDRRLKENIKTSTLGLNFIKKLRPVTFNFKNDKSKTLRIGLLAQEVKKAADELGVKFPGWSVGPDGYQNLTYTDFIMPLINAIKEQQNMIEKQQRTITELKQKIADIEAKLR